MNCSARRLRARTIFGSRALFAVASPLPTVLCRRAIVAKRRAVSSGSGPVSIASSSSSAPSSPFLVLGLARFLAYHGLRVVRLRDLVRRVRVEEADDEVGDAALARLHRLAGARAGSRRSAGNRRERCAPGRGLPRCAWRCGSRLRASAARPCPSRACTCAPGRWCGRTRSRRSRARRPLPRRLLRRARTHPSAATTRHPAPSRTP